MPTILIILPDEEFFLVHKGRRIQLFLIHPSRRSYDFLTPLISLIHTGHQVAFLFSINFMKSLFAHQSLSIELNSVKYRRLQNLWLFIPIRSVYLL